MMTLLVSIMCLILAKDGVLAEDVQSRLLGTLFESYDYNKMVRPGSYDKPLVVSHEYNFIRVVDLDVEDQVLTLDVWDWMYWTDERLIWDMSHFDVDVIRVEPDRLWMPDIELYDSADKPLDKLNQHFVWVDNKGGCVYVISARIKTNCAVDDHIDAGDHVTCNITLGSWWYDDHNMDLEGVYAADASKMLEGFKDTNRDWAMNSIHIVRSAKKYECCPNPFITLDYVIDLKRKNHISHH